MTGEVHFSTSIAVVLVLSLPPGVTGCSYGFVQGPGLPGEVTRDERGRARPSSEVCTTSNAVPIVDTVLGVPLVGLGVLAFVIAASGYCNGGFCALDSGGAFAIGAVASGLGAAFLASAITGYRRTDDCRQAQAALSGGPHPSARYLLGVEGIAEARARSRKERQ